MIHRQLQKLLPVVILGSKLKLSLQANTFVRVYAHCLLQCKQGNLRFRLIINSQGFDPVRLDACFIRVERGGRAFACAIPHQTKEVAVDLEKLFDKLQVAYRSERLTETHAHFSGEQALLIRHALLRGFFLAHRDLGTACSASEELQWQRCTDVDRVITAVDFFESTKSQGRVLPQASLRHISARHGDLLTLRQQGGVGSQGPRYEVRLGNSTLEIEEITRWPGLDILRGERQRTCQRHRHQRPQSISK